jgi:multiple sugar transport system substrate-binding protein
VLLFALGGSLLMRVTKSPSGLPSSTPTGTLAATASATTAKTTVAWNAAITGGPVMPEVDFVNNYNATNKDNIQIEVQTWLPSCMNCDFADDIAAGTVDLVGPLSIGDFPRLSDYWLGLNDLIAKNQTDLSAYPPALMNTLKNSAGQYVGLPYIENPAFIFYNKDLFRKAGLPDLPTKVGQQYMGHDWTWDELATIAKQLTVDTSGKKSTDAGFNPAKIKTYGFDTQWINDLRRFATPFGAGSYVAADGKTAQIPAAWEQAWKWYYDAMWKSHFAPTNAERMAADMGNGTTVATGRVAMDLAWDWGIYSFGPNVADASGAPSPTTSFSYAHWDMGVLPSNGGVTTDPIDVDTFMITKNSKHADAAYKAMLAIMAAPSLRGGGMPADPSLQPAYFKTAQTAVDKQFADNPVSWSVLAEMARYAGTPAFDALTPNYVRAETDDQALYTELQSQGGLNLDAEIAKFKAKLQADFNAPAATP